MVADTEAKSPLLPVLVPQLVNVFPVANELPPISLPISILAAIPEPTKTIP